MKIREIISDFLILAGCGMVIYAAFQIFPIAGWVTGGVAVIVLGYALGKESDPS